jgi:hypothetical protein
MAFMAVAIGVIGVAVAVMIGYLVVAQIQSTMPTGAAGSAVANISAAMDTTRSTVFAGFSLLAVGIIVLAAFGLIQIFQ